MIVYQVLPRLWRRGTLAGFDKATFQHLRSLGVTHIWLTGIPRHARGEAFVKGDPGSPYSISDWYDVNPYLVPGAHSKSARIDSFRRLVDKVHSEGLGVITDFVPNHVAPTYTDDRGGIPTLGIHDYDWTDTVKVDYSNRDTWHRMLAVLEFWASLGVDGFRCDMVELVPAEFFGWAFERVRTSRPAVKFIGEVYDRGNYRRYLDVGGFDLLYDKSGLYDTLRAIVSCGAPAYNITGCWQRQGDVQGRIIHFLENHDEQRLASPQFAGCPSKGYAALAVSVLFQRAPFLLYFGQEFGENAADGADGRTSIFNFARTVGPVAPSAEAKAVLERYRSILNLHNEVETWPNWDLCYCQSDSDGFDFANHFAFLRYRQDGLADASGLEAVIVVCNFSAEPAHIQLHLPSEVLQLLDEQSRSAFVQIAATCPSPSAFVSAEVAPHDYTIIKIH